VIVENRLKGTEEKKQKGIHSKKEEEEEVTEVQNDLLRGKRKTKVKIRCQILRVSQVGRDPPAAANLCCVTNVLFT
jgi:hypothetical protein